MFFSVPGAESNRLMSDAFGAPHRCGDAKLQPIRLAVYPDTLLSRMNSRSSSLARGQESNLLTGDLSTFCTYPLCAYPLAPLRAYYSLGRLGRANGSPDVQSDFYCLFSAMRLCSSLSAHSMRNALRLALMASNVA